MGIPDRYENNNYKIIIIIFYYDNSNRRQRNWNILSVEIFIRGQKFSHFFTDNLCWIYELKSSWNWVNWI